MVFGGETFADGWKLMDETTVEIAAENSIDG